MRKKFIASTLVAMALAAGAVCNAIAVPSTQFAQAFSAAEYQALAVEQRQIYVAGVLDTVRIFAPSAELKAFYNVCLTRTTLGQVTAVVDARASHPEPIDQGLMPLIVHNAVAAECNRSGFRY
ncbi:hypothetical protein KTD19_28505 [Burkholderia multivorans]|uniref:hypothetical protein n=1 Tax=Burkholderia cepacia complex TaxID=87882 RepID=UPI000A044058|nr:MULTISPECIES: hypothetical protein [Burkholderia cepacia complex]MBU9236319.1 hypothetical protein [Burkholderia multivorans]MCO1362866.1 hypothetical protein [Burkholderia multivorans]MCO1422751.1 hypothetical protein [Burkholderia multivorans]MDC6086388.1 hypothetical protein [Burkholderia cenocepacia]UQO98764.1 hypothetical protein L0Z41_29185 [Burkholderia multivorans]